MKRFKIIVYWLVAIILLFVIQGLILIRLYEKEIKTEAVNELNKFINTPIKVEQIDLNFWNHFPFVSLRFNNIVASGSNNSLKSPLFKAEELSLLFNFWEIYRKNFIVHKLYIRNAYWNSAYDKYGVSNFDILKVDTLNTNQSEKFKLSIKSIVFENSNINHIDYKSKDTYSFHILNCTAKGNFSEKNFKLELLSNGRVNKLSVSGTKYIDNKNYDLNSILSVDLINDKYTFENTFLKIEKFSSSIHGSIQLMDQSELYDLSIKGEKTDIQSLLSLLPPKNQAMFNAYNSKGQMDINLKILGKNSQNSIPLIYGSTTLTNTEITISEENFTEKINNINTHIIYSNNKTIAENDDYINIESLKADINNQEITGYLKYSNFVTPNIELKLKTNQNLSDIQFLFAESKIHPNSGSINIDVYIKGLLKDLKDKNEFGSLVSNGDIKINNASFAIDDSKLTIEKLNAAFTFQKFDLKINQLTTEVGASNFSIKGYFRNIVSILLDKNEPIEIDATLESNYIDLYELLSSNTKNNSEEFQLIINPRIDANIKLKVKKLQFELFDANTIEGALGIHNQIVNSDYVAFSAHNGLVFAKLNFNTQNPARMPMNIDFSLQNVDISNAFYEFNNFGLDIIKSDNIHGNITSSMHVDMMWNKNLISNLDDFYAKGDIVIENGRLTNFDPLLSLSKYLDVNDLKNLEFSKLENSIEIKDKTTIIPEMYVQSNALNLNVFGTHTFNNKIDYHLKILLSDILRRKSKKLSDERFGEIEEDGSGKNTLFLRMYGDVDNPKFSLDKQQLKNKIKSDLKNEKSLVNDILKEEFKNWFKKDQEFKESIIEEQQEWEKDLPQKKNAPKIDTSTTKVKKSNLKKLKDKLNEPVEVDE